MKSKKAISHGEEMIVGSIVVIIFMLILLMASIGFNRSKNGCWQWQQEKVEHTLSNISCENLRERILVGVAPTKTDYYCGEKLVKSYNFPNYELKEEYKNRCLDLDEEEVPRLK